LTTSDYLGILRRHWILIVAAAILGLLVGGGLSALIKPTYTARTQLFVSMQNSGSVQELQQGNTFTQARVQSYVRTIETPIVLQPVIDRLGLRTTPDKLADKVKAEADLNTVLINIAVVDSSADRAAAIAKATAESLIAAVDTLEKPKTGGNSPVNLSVVTPAVPPDTPTAPSTRKNLALGLFLGLLAGLTAAFLRTALDNKVRGETDLRKTTDAPLLGAIPFDQQAIKSPLLSESAGYGPRAESYRQLRTNLQFTNVSGQKTAVLITSSAPGEGKTTTAINLAITLAQAGQKVCLVDADLRRPMVHEYLGLENGVGLTTALMGTAQLDGALQPWGSGKLVVLTSGQIPPNPSELLGSEEMQDLVTCLRHDFQTVIIDSPPLLPVTDAAVLSQHVDGVTVVVGSQKIKHHDLAKALNTLSMVGAPVLGIILNRVPAKGPDAYTYASSELPKPGSLTGSGRRSAA
jgi:capsular exopolysaccharide synthesis family protein